MKRWMALLSLLNLASCQQRTDYAPVTEAYDSRQINTQTIYYSVKPHDTLYTIAFRYDKDYRLLAAINRLYPPYRLVVGQKIRLQAFTMAEYPTYFKPSYTPARKSLTPKRMRYPHSSAVTHLLWPTQKHHISTYFSPSLARKGIDIIGKRGDKIFAAGSGVVAYAGDGLTGYGNLIIIKHDHQLLTAYGHNARNLVREGQNIHAGQAIADMGQIDRRLWGVHFETRLNGKPVNPLSYLK